MFVRACSDYLDVIRGLRERADQLQISREAIDDLSGLSDGYSAKLLSIPPVKTIGFMSMSPLFETLGVRLMLVEDTEHTAKTLTRRTPRVEGHVRTGHVRRKPQPDLALVNAAGAAQIAAPVPDAPVPSAPPVPSPAPKAPEQSHSHLHIIQFKRGGRSRVASRI